MPFYCLQSLCSRHCFRSTGQPPGSDPGHHSLYQLGGVERCGLFKGRIIHLGTVIRLVGNGTDDDKGNTVQVSTVGNGSPLHLGTVPLKFFDQAVLDFFAGNELISADYTPGMNVNVRIDLLTGAGSNLDKMLICKEFPASQLGNFPRLVTENGGIYIMVQGILGDQNISDVQSGIQGSCHTGVDDGSDLKKVCQNLYAESGIDFADTAADDDYGSCLLYTSPSPRD